MTARLVELADERALAKLAGLATRLQVQVKAMQAAAQALPLPIRIQTNNVQEELDLLRHRLREAALRRAIQAKRKA